MSQVLRPRDPPPLNKGILTHISWEFTVFRHKNFRNFSSLGIPTWLMDPKGAFDCAWVMSCTCIVTTGVNACTVIIITGMTACIGTRGFGCAGVESRAVS